MIHPPGYCQTMVIVGSRRGIFVVKIHRCAIIIMQDKTLRIFPDKPVAKAIRGVPKNFSKGFATDR